MTFRLLSVLGLLLPLTTAANAGEGASPFPHLSAKVYETGSARKKLLFAMNRDEKSAGDQTTITEVYTDPGGAEALRSETLLKDGNFVSYHLDQKQVHEKASIEARDGKLYFEYTDANGKTKKDDERWQDSFVLPTTMGHLMHVRWQDLLAGKDIDMRFGVPDRRETVGFKIFKDGEKKLDGKDVVIAKMKPTSMLISALVKPLFFYYEKATGKLLEFDGRTLVKQKDGDHYKDLDAETVYSY